MAPRQNVLTHHPQIRLCAVLSVSSSPRAVRVTLACDIMLPLLTPKEKPVRRAVKAAMARVLEEGMKIKVRGHVCITSRLHVTYKVNLSFFSGT